LEKARQADVVIIGSPVYFGYPTGLVRAFIERFLFPKYSYDSNVKLVNPKNTACIFTMNCPREFMEQINYPILLGNTVDGLKHVYGFGEALYICNTYQFDDYSKMAFDMFTEDDKRAYRDAHFEEDMAASRDLGRRLVEDARKRLNL
ncbi:MAG: flavodoxin family protein, partial [Muribaculaceae bacterium]|nr:flavodoxin family protein [Muribaculaceae bacterium]